MVQAALADEHGGIRVRWRGRARPETKSPGVLCAPLALQSRLLSLLSALDAPRRVCQSAGHQAFVVR